MKNQIHMFHFVTYTGIFVSNKKVPTDNYLCLCVAVEKCDEPCTHDQFTCDNGCCLDPGLECDKTPQCSDQSDEQNCDEGKGCLVKLHLIFN